MIGGVAVLVELTCVGAHVFLLAVVNRQDLVVGLGRRQAPPNLAPVLVDAIGHGARLVGGGAVSVDVVGDDADRREGDVPRRQRQLHRTARLLAVEPDAAEVQPPLGRERAQVLDRLARTGDAEVVGVVVGGRNQVEAEVGQEAHARRVRAKPERHRLTLVGGGEIVAIGDHRLEVHEVEIAVDQLRDLGRQLRPGRRLRRPRARRADRRRCCCG